MRIRQHLRSNVVGYIALFVALSGTAWAASELSKNEVKSRHIKNGAVKKRDLAKNSVDTSKVVDGSLLEKDFASDLTQGPRGPQGPQGERGPQGPAGQDATKLFAYIRDDGSAVTASVQYGSGVTAVSDLTPGVSQYQVTFNRSLVNCVVQAANGFGNPRAGGNAYPRSIPFVNRGDADDQASVEFTDPVNGATVDTSFLITAFC